MINVKNIYHLRSKTIIYVQRIENKHPRGCADQNLVIQFNTASGVLRYICAM